MGKKIDLTGVRFGRLKTDSLTTASPLVYQKNRQVIECACRFLFKETDHAR